MYSILLNSSNFGKFLGYEFYRSCISVQKKKKEAVILHLHPPENVSLGSFTLLACSSRKNCTKSIMHMQSCCFASLLNQLLLCPSHYCCCCRCLNPIFNFFPCRSQFGLKVIGHLLLPLIGFFTCVFDSWLLVNTKCTRTSRLSCQFAWINIIETIQQWYFPLRMLFHLYFNSKKCMKSKINGNAAKNPKN